MTIFNTKGNGNRIFENWDGHTDIPIYKQGVSQVGNTQTHYSMNVEEKLNAALDSLPSALNNLLNNKNNLSENDRNAINHWLTTTKLSSNNAYVASINMGWEIRGLDIGTMTIDNLSLSHESSAGGVSAITNFSAKLFWNDSFNNENGFGIYRNDILIATVPANITHYTLTNLNNNTDYTYVVKAFTNEYESAIATINFQTTNIIPNAPTNMRVLYVTSHSATLKWNDNSDNEAGFQIYRNNTLIATVSENITRYELDNLSSDTLYTYKVKAYSSDLKSDADNVSFLTLDVIPLAPQNFRASTIETTSVTLSWTDKSSNETGFKIYQDGELITNVGAGTTSYTINNLESRQSYTYAIKSYNDIGKSNALNITILTKDDYAWLVPVYYMLLD